MRESDRFRQALELMELGFSMQMQNLRRRHPEWREHDVQEAMDRWVMERPGPKLMARSEA